MAKKLTKKINNRFNPTNVSGIPVYAYGGKMKYEFGGLTGAQIENAAAAKAGQGPYSSGGGQGWAQGISMLGQAASAYNSTQDRPDYSAQTYQGMDKGKSDSIANAAAASNPFVGAFKAIGEGASGMLADQDEYGVKSGSKAAIFASNVFDPRETTESLFKGNGLNVNKNKKAARQKLITKQQGQELAANLPGSTNYTPTFAGGGKVGEYPNGKIKPINDRVSSIESGTTHAQSPTNGVPLGKNALVEDSEFIFRRKNGEKYVFSDRF